jgi:predicted nucleic acid-binding protein
MKATRVVQIRSTLEIHPFDELAAANYGAIRVHLEKKGAAISGTLLTKNKQRVTSNEWKATKTVQRLTFNI